MSALLEPGERTVTGLWTTACGVRRMDVPSILRPFDIPLEGLQREFLALDTALSEAKHPDGKVKMTVQVWRRGFELVHYSSSSDLVDWCFLHGTEPRHQDSGSVALLDPRAGSEGTAMPGLPWGREVTFRPSPGLLAVVPGWFTSTVRPVEEGQAVVVAVASKTA
ncbi:hypothetical protein [Streptomyces chartreusis]|uniref:hypothetical protein n=1 Tax=Streptomyces chartreusis TaxID=1969 RepID=UPI0033CCCF63